MDFAVIQNEFAKRPLGISSSQVNFAKHHLARLDASKRGTGERRSSSREPKRRLDDEEFTSLSPRQMEQRKLKEKRESQDARQPGQPYKKQSKNKKRRMEQ